MSNAIFYFNYTYLVNIQYCRLCIFIYIIWLRNAGILYALKRTTLSSQNEDSGKLNYMFFNIFMIKIKRSFF